MVLDCSRGHLFHEFYASRLGIVLYKYLARSCMVAGNSCRQVLEPLVRSGWEAVHSSQKMLAHTSSKQHRMISLKYDVSGGLVHTSLYIQAGITVI